MVCVKEPSEISYAQVRQASLVSIAGGTDMSYVQVYRKVDKK
jgi:hypothetical protein